MPEAFTIPSWPVLLPLFLAAIVYISLQTFMKRTNTFRQYLFQLATAVYAVGVLHLVFFPIDVHLGPYANQTPWYKTVNWIPILTLDVKTFVLNIVMLVPLGFLLPLLRAGVNRVSVAAKTAFHVSFGIEAIQLIIRITLGNGRSTDINDLIANTLGGVLGYLLYRMVKRVR